MLKNFIRHLNKINKHRWYVFLAMCKCGRPFQGLLHDVSKYSPTEFWESVKYYQGTSSPLEVAKKDKGYSAAYFHHMGRNKHHSVYWVDITWGKIKPAKMPWKYVVEHICDTIGAGKAYMGDKWTKSAPMDWWELHDKNSFYHNVTRDFIIYVYETIKVFGWDFAVEHILKNEFIRNKYESNDGTYHFNTLRNDMKSSIEEIDKEIDNNIVTKGVANDK